MVGPFVAPKRRIFGRKSARWRTPFGAGGRQRRQELARIDRTVAATQLEMELWLGDAAGGAHARNRLASVRNALQQMGISSSIVQAESTNNQSTGDEVVVFAQTVAVLPPGSVTVILAL